MPETAPRPEIRELSCLTHEQGVPHARHGWKWKCVERWCPGIPEPAEPRDNNGLISIDNGKPIEFAPPAEPETASRPDVPARGVHVIPGQVPTGVVPPSTSMATPTASRPDDAPPLRSSIPPHQLAGYDAVYDVIRSKPGDAWRNALIWSAVEAYRTASEAAHEKQVRERAADELFQRFQRMREDGEHDMRTALHHVRDVLRGGS